MLRSCQILSIFYNSEAIEVDGESSVSSIKIFNEKDNVVNKLEVNAVFMAVGYKPNTEF